MHKAVVKPTTTVPGQSGTPVFISRLINSIYFYIETCFITPESLSAYRLLAFKEKKVLHDYKYRTIRAARSAFNRAFSKKSLKNNLPPVWSNFYPPDPEWIENYLSIAARGE